MIVKLSGDAIPSKICLQFLLNRLFSPFHILRVHIPVSYNSYGVIIETWK